jgi:hypothetical protein
MLERIQSICQECGYRSSSWSAEEEDHRIHPLIARVEGNRH